MKRWEEMTNEEFTNAIWAMVAGMANYKPKFSKKKPPIKNI